MNISKQMGDQLQAFFLDYFNNYMTAACIAEHNGITTEHANELINMGRIIHETRVEAWNYCADEVKKPLANELTA